jgi:hypothetical protein
MRNTGLLLASLVLVYGAWRDDLACAADYHISTAGDDAWDGSSPEQAWRTVPRANRQALRPGDRLLFRGGDTFEGNLVVKTSGAPSAATPVTVGSYGGGRAVIRAGGGTGVLIENIGGVMVRDLVVESANRRTNSGSGVSILNTLAGGKRLDQVRIENVEARGFGKYGIAVGGWPADKSQSGYRDVRIDGCHALDNAYAGIHVYGVHDYYAKTYAHAGVAVVNCVARDNPGDPNYVENHSGNGILLHDVDGGRVESCTASGNGALCRARSGGPVGIWAYSSRKLVIERCVSVGNRTGGKFDGGGFDFDGGVTESIMQYNYSGQNDGAGYLVFDFGAAPFPLADNVIRFNISENDGRKNGYAGIMVNSAGPPVKRVQIYHNTVFVEPSAEKERPSAVFIGKSEDCRVHNNLLIAADGCSILNVGGKQSGLRIQGNHYWAARGDFLVRDEGKEVRSLGEWRRRGWERIGDQDAGSVGDPRVSGLGGGAAPASAEERAKLNRFKLHANSPLRRSGLDLRRLYKLDIGERDFWGQRLLPDEPPAVGAHSRP